MSDLIQNYNFNGLYICLALVIFNIYKSNYQYIYFIFNKLYLFDHISFIIIINIIAIYFILKKISFQVNIKWTIKYN